MPAWHRRIASPPRRAWRATALRPARLNSGTLRASPGFSPSSSGLVSRPAWRSTSPRAWIQGRRSSGRPARMSVAASGRNRGRRCRRRAPAARCPSTQVDLAHRHAQDGWSAPGDMDLARGRQRAGRDLRKVAPVPSQPGFKAVGIVSGTWTSLCRRPGRMPNEGGRRERAMPELFLSLRRHDPDQVQRVTAPSRSQPLLGHPLEHAVMLRRAGHAVNARTGLGAHAARSTAAQTGSRLAVEGVASPSRPPPARGRSPGRRSPARRRRRHWHERRFLAARPCHRPRHRPTPPLRERSGSGAAGGAVAGHRPAPGSSRSGCGNSAPHAGSTPPPSRGRPTPVASRPSCRYFSKSCCAVPRNRMSGPFESNTWLRFIGWWPPWRYPPPRRRRHLRRRHHAGGCCGHACASCCSSVLCLLSRSHGRPGAPELPDVPEIAADLSQTLRGRAVHGIHRRTGNARGQRRPKPITERTLWRT